MTSPDIGIVPLRAQLFGHTKQRPHHINAGYGGYGANRITSNGAVYDANGNMTANGTPRQVTNFSYDEANRLSLVW